MICKKEVLDIYVSGRGSAIILVGVCQEKAGEIEKNPNAECNESGNQITVDVPLRRASRFKGSASR